MRGYTMDWREIAFTAKCKTKWTCQGCGEDCDPNFPGNLGVHHKDYDKANNDPSNLIVLCWPCHKSTHLRNDPVFYHGEEPEDYWRMGLPKPVATKGIVNDVLPQYLKIQRINLKEVDK